MRTKLYLGLAMAWLAAGGCFSPRPSAPASFEHLAARNLTQEPTRWVDQGCFKEFAYTSAKASWRKIWEETCRQRPDQPYPHDFAKGFIEGFVDYLDAGGNGEPPVAAPFCYRLLKYKSPAGVQAAEAWFAGFRYGASVAQASGLREVILVPLSGPVTPATAPTQPAVASTIRPESETSTSPATRPAPPPTLPAPRPFEELPAPREEPGKDAEKNISSVGAWRPAR
jgi:hypothetical protein